MGGDSASAANSVAITLSTEHPLIPAGNPSAKDSDHVSNANVGESAQTDVVLVGAGIMSATLGALIRLLEPE